ncbi:MAG: hypothetical protein ACKVUS_21210 [Saprospiraceae bacterium]
MGDFQDRKTHLLDAVHAINDEGDLAEWEEVYQKIKARRERMLQYRATLREKFDPETVRRSRGYRKPDKANVMRLIKQMNVQEPVELLLSQLTICFWVLVPAALAAGCAGGSQYSGS